MFAEYYQIIVVVSGYALMHLVLEPQNVPLGIETLFSLESVSEE